MRNNKRPSQDVLTPHGTYHQMSFTSRFLEFCPLLFLTRIIFLKKKKKLVKIILMKSWLCSGYHLFLEKIDKRTQNRSLSLLHKNERPKNPVGSK